MSLYEKISELEEKKQSLMDEMERNKKSSPAEERERLLKQVASIQVFQPISGFLFVSLDHRNPEICIARASPTTQKPIP